MYTNSRGVWGEGDGDLSQRRRQYSPFGKKSKIVSHYAPLVYMYSGVIYTRTRTPPMLSGPFGYDFEAETTNVLRNQRPPPRLVTNRRVSLQTTGLSTRPLVAPLSRLFERTTPPAESDATNTRENTNRVDLFSRPIFTYDSTVFNGSSFVFFTFPPGVCIYIYTFRRSCTCYTYESVPARAPLSPYHKRGFPFSFRHTPRRSYSRRNERSARYFARALTTKSTF